ncbi:MAG: hypothetical protein IJR15_04330 [Clostridiales bacterium]|nr:hypothetical protein [Clostridiales bacterium]
MCQIWDEIREEGVMMGKEENALKMIADNLPLETIARYTGLPLERIKELAEAKPALSFLE